MRATGMVPGVLLLLSVGFDGATLEATRGPEAIRQASVPMTISTRIRRVPVGERPMANDAASAGHIAPNNEPFEAPDLGQGAFEDAAMPYTDAGASGPAGRSPIEGVRARHEQDLMAIDGVLGVAIGRTPIGDDAVVVYLRDASVRQRVPPGVDGYPVETVVTGEIDAYGVGGGASGPLRSP